EAPLRSSSSPRAQNLIMEKQGIDAIDYIAERKLVKLYSVSSFKFQVSSSKRWLSSWNLKLET
ncbi:MAG TPA: hypothetical protein VEV81_13165, partial [Pyrinomonadaceae bacterium]|nr:hypothetical protein [Pyrinomonadaceae bacterium]